MSLAKLMKEDRWVVFWPPSPRVESWVLDRRRWALPNNSNTCKIFFTSNSSNSSFKLPEITTSPTESSAEICRTQGLLNSSNNQCSPL